MKKIEKEKVKTTKKILKKNKKNIKKRVTKKKVEVSMSNSDNNSNASDIDYELSYKIGDYVIVKYEREYFPGIVNDTNPESAQVSAIVMSGKGWNWPEVENEILYSYETVMQIIKAPEFLIPDGIFLVPEITKYRKW